MTKTKAFLLLVLLLFSLAALLSWRSTNRNPVTYAKPIDVPVPICSSFPVNWSDTTLADTRLLPGLGSLNYLVSSKSKDAQAFFNQGLRLVYAFNHWEAVQSFRKAIDLDGEFAMAYWGLALAYGPNLNDINPQDREKLAFEAIQTAIKKSSRTTQRETDFIRALSARYDGNAYADRSPLNEKYATAMLALATKYPDDTEIQTLCADAIMNTMPWDYWQNDGTAKPATAQAKKLLENLLSKHPAHPGANHLYIHLVEASPNPAQALASAQVLETAMPGAGHMVHMPAHIYLRTGNYARSIQSNQKAVAVDEHYLASSQNYGMYRWAYYPHNIDFISFSAYQQGRSKLAYETVMKLAYKGSMITGTNPVFAQYFTVEPMIAYVRFGQWAQILSLPEPDQSLIHAQLMHRFSRGMALLRTGKLADAEWQSAKLDSISKLDTLKSIYFSFNPLSDIAKVPAAILKGEILLKKKNIGAALQQLEQAVAFEDALRYMEPPDWKLPSRQYLGKALLDQKKFAEAISVYEADLRKNAENGWSLFGLWQAQLQAGDNQKAEQINKRFIAAWAEADIKLSGSAF